MRGLGISSIMALALAAGCDDEAPRICEAPRVQALLEVTPQSMSFGTASLCTRWR